MSHAAPLPVASTRSLAETGFWREEDVFVGEGREKVRTATSLYALTEPSTREEFDEAFGLLNDQFGPTGEIESADTLAQWFTYGSLSAADAPIRAHYHMVIARERIGENAGAIAAVRDCFVTVEEKAAGGARAHVLLSHSLVLPAHRRTGVGALLRHVPIALARRHLAAFERRVDAPEGSAGADNLAQILLFAEMDQVTADDRNTVIRLLAYGRAGFRVVPPAILPFAQPDFRDEVQHGDVEPRPLPFLCVVREVGAETTQDLAPATLRAVVEHALAVHRCHARPDHLDAIRRHALTALDAHGASPVRLLDLPARAEEIAMLAPLLRPTTFPLYPPTWRGDAPLSRPEDELSALIAAWVPPSTASRPP